MSTVNVPATGVNTFTVLSATSINYNGTVYENVTDIAYPDGSHKTCAQIIQDAGGDSYSPSELKACVKVQGIDPDQNGRQVFMAYSTNSASTGKNSVDSIEGGLTIDMFDFSGDVNSNYILAMWQSAYYPNGGAPNPLPVANVGIRGFKINYGISESRSYVMTQVNDAFEESVPSPPINIGTTLMHDVLLSGVYSAARPLGNNQYLPMAQFKLYRAALTSDGSFDYERVPADPVSVPLNGVPAVSPSLGLFPGGVQVAYPEPNSPLAYAKFGYTILDNFLQQDLLESMVSLDWDAPPPRGLMGLAAWRNGIMTAFSGNQLYFCEPYRPFTFPQQYIKALPYNILATRVDGTDLVVITDQEPYVFRGAHPAQVTYDKLPGVQAGLQPVVACIVAGVTYRNPTRAITRTPMGIYYASREGMMRVYGGQATAVWRDIFTREEWVNRYGAVFGLMRLAYFDGHILVYFDGNAAPGFLVNISSDDTQLSEWTGPGNQVADFVLPLTDSMYVVTLSGNTSTISRFADEGQPRQACTYWTRDVILPKPCNMGALQLVGTGNVTVSVYADNNLIAGPTLMALGAVSGQKYIRLPSGYKARRFSLLMSLAVGAEVSEAYIVETLLELQTV